MSRLLSLIGALTILAASPVQAFQIGWRGSDNSASQSLSRASDGAFGVMLVLTDDWDAFTQRWQQPSPGFDAPDVGPIPKGRPVVSTIIFTGCMSDTDGNSSVTGDFQAIDPNGKIYADQKEASIWTLPPPPPWQLQLAAGGFGLRLDPPDPLGTYTVIARITDHVANKTLEVRTTFLAR